MFILRTNVKFNIALSRAFENAGFYKYPHLGEFHPVQMRRMFGKLLKKNVFPDGAILKIWGKTKDELYYRIENYFDLNINNIDPEGRFYFLYGNDDYITPSIVFRGNNYHYEIEYGFDPLFPDIPFVDCVFSKPVMIGNHPKTRTL